MSPFLEELQTSPDTRVHTSEDGRGHATFAVRDFAAGEVIFQEPALILVYPSRDPAWLAELRAELDKEDSALAWQYCVAAHCLVAAELPRPAPPGLQPFSDASVAKLADLCGAEDDDGGTEPSELARTTAAHLFRASESESAAAFAEWRTAAASALPVPAAGETAGEHDRVLRWLAGRLDDVAVRVSRNGFQIADMSCRPPAAADGMFHRISFFNHCCAGMNNASWVWKGAEGLLTVKATRDVKAGEELTISYIAKPWCDLGKAARRRYLKQNFNFVCLCKACCLPAAAERPSEGGEAEEAGRKAKGKSKLASMLVRWMQDDHEDADDGQAAEPSADRGSSAVASSAPPGPKPELTDEQRLERVLQRCGGEGLEVGREDAAAALEAEGGHVGKTMIRLRRSKKAAASEDPPPTTAPPAQSERSACASVGGSGAPPGFSSLQVVLAVGLGVAALALARWRLARRA